MAYRDESNMAFGGVSHGPASWGAVLANRAAPANRAEPGCVKLPVDVLVDFVVWLKSERSELMESGKALRLLREAAAEYERATSSAKPVH